ncbi:MAG: hypothetical protein DSM106950_17210 [Stigonema ocellatum SAG 48.90 = DSM 106950]|nr:hypothetical protein [Stigonema ocellatum SAG 48.90 = DSM 106950]
MSQLDDLKLAKQGDARAIAALMNRCLESKGITVVESTLKNGCLQVILESGEVPNQQILVTWIRKSMTSLNPASIDRVRVYCRQTGMDFISWTEQFALNAIPSIDTHQSLEQDKEEALRKNHVLPKLVGTDIKQGYSFIPPRGQAVIAFLLIIGLFSGCVYQVGYPWNCAQARQATNEAESHYQQATNKVTYFNAKDESVGLKVRLFIQAQTKEAELCNN